MVKSERDVFRGRFKFGSKKYPIFFKLKFLESGKDVENLFD